MLVSVLQKCCCCTFTKQWYVDVRCDKTWQCKIAFFEDDINNKLACISLVVQGKSCMSRKARIEPFHKQS